LAFNTTKKHLAIIITKTLKSKWFKALNCFINNFIIINNWNTARQNMGLYSFTENNTVIFIFINNYNKARIFFLFKRHKKAAISLLHANESICNNNTYQKPTKRHSWNPVEFIKAYCTSIKEIKQRGDLFISSIKLYHFITKIIFLRTLFLKYSAICWNLIKPKKNCQFLNSKMVQLYKWTFILPLSFLCLGSPDDFKAPNWNKIKHKPKLG